jgi:hypothetical protein
VEGAVKLGSCVEDVLADDRDVAELSALDHAAINTSCSGRNACDHASVVNQPVEVPRNSEMSMSHAASDVAAGDPLTVMVLSYLDDPEIKLRADDPDAERRVNTWHYSLPVGFDLTAVAAALEHVVRQLSKRHRARPGTFYCWYDEQAGSSAAP